MTDMGIHQDDLQDLEQALGTIKSDWLRLALTLAYVLGKRRQAKLVEERNTLTIKLLEP